MYLEDSEVEKFGLQAESMRVLHEGIGNGCNVKRADYNPVRTTDPATSHRAAQTATQRRASIKDHILIELAVHGGCTGEEIANRTTLRLNSITPRFAELTRAGKIKDSGTTRNKQIVWVLT